MADEKASDSGVHASKVTYIDGRERMIEMLDSARQKVEAGEIDGLAMAMSIDDEEKGIEHAWAVRNDGDAVRMLGAVARLARRIEDSFVTTDVKEENEHGA